MGPERSTLSSKNPRIAHLRRLSGRRRSRAEHGQYVVEGITLVIETLDAGVDIEGIYVDLDAPDTPEVDELLRRASDASVPVHWLEPGVLAKVADTVSPQPALAVVNGAPLDLATWWATAPSGLVLVLAGVADPGNAGTLVRTAEAAGAAAVVFAADAVDPLSPKTVRSSAGSALRVPLVSAGPLVEVVDELRAHRFRVVGTALHDAVGYTEADLTGDVALVLGNEAHGLDDAAIGRFDETLAIPMRGAVESLNVAVAGSLIAFESARQRAMAGPGHPPPRPAAQ